MSDMDHVSIEAKIETIPGYCTLCKSRCGVLNTVKGGRLISVEPLRTHPTGRAVCAKGRSAPEFAHSSRRLTHPLRRTTPRGSDDPSWKEISWDEALDEIASRLRTLREEHGAESVAFALTSPSATPIVDSVEWIERFIALYGSPNVCNATEICGWARDVAHAFTFGCPLPQPDWANADLILLWGHNPATVWLSEAGEVAEAVKRGARLAVIDPRRTSHAREATHWLSVRPGTDAALALAMAHLLIESDRFDKAFLRRWSNAPFLVRLDDGRFLRGRDLQDGAVDDDSYVVYDAAEGGVRRHDPRRQVLDSEMIVLTGRFDIEGIVCRTAFETYAERCTSYTVDRAEQITGVPAVQIRDLADAIGNARTVAHAQWTGTAQHTNATQTSRAIAALYALTGHFDAPGGNVRIMPHKAGAISDKSLLPEEQRLKSLGAVVRPIGPAALGMVTSSELYDAILDGEPYRVRALVTFGSNLLLSRAETARGQQALRALDFQVHCDMFETPTAREADILLPVSGPWEREALKIGFEITHEAQELIQLRPALVPRVAQSRSDAEIVCALADRLGFADRMFGADIEAGWRHQLAPLGLSLEALREQPEGIRLPLPRGWRKFAETVDGGPRGFATDTGRVEIYSEMMLRNGYDPLPQAETVQHEADRAAAEFPVQLTCAKNPYFCHSQHRGSVSLRRRAREPMVAISPSLAALHGIAEGDWTIVHTRVGEARFRASLNADLRNDVAVADFGWWQGTPELGLAGYDPFGPEGSNFNLLVDSRTVDPVSGAAPLKSFPCRVSRAASTSPAAWKGRRSLKIIGRTVEPGGIVALDLANADQRRLPPFLPGQHIAVAADIGGRTVSRSYSLCGTGDSNGPASYRIAIKRIKAIDGQAEEGLFSSYCALGLHVGSLLETGSPAGTFVIPTAADFPVVLVAAGVGITPFLAYLEALQDASDPPEVYLHYANRNGSQHAFRERIDELAKRQPRLTVINHYSRPTADDRASRAFVEGRVHALSFGQDLIARRARFYMCGPEEMMQTMTADLRVRGVPRFEIFSEPFISPPLISLSGSTAKFDVTFARSGRTAIWSQDQGDLLTFAESQGLAPPSGCRVGQCESCALTVLKGAVTHVTPVADIDDDVCLACQAIPASDLVLDL